MRLVLGQPPIEDFYSTPHRLSAMGGFSIKGLLEKQGHSVTLFNFSLGSQPRPLKPRKVPLPAYASHLESYLMEEKGPVSYFTRWQRWGPAARDCARTMLDCKPGCVLLSLFAWSYGEELLELARAVKEEARARGAGFVPVIIGGAGVTVLPESFASSPHVDLVLAGEGEVLFHDYSLEELVRRSAAGQAGLCGMPSGRSEPGISIGAPSGKILRAEGFCSESGIEPVISRTTGGRNHTQAVTILSRGCPRLCRFCSNRLSQGSRHRKIPPEILADAFRSTLRAWDLSRDMKLTLDLEDDNLLLDKTYFIEVIKEFRKIWEEDGREAERLMFTAENGMDYGLLDEDLMEKLISLGFRQFNFSLASADKFVLAREKRFFAPDKLKSLLVLAGERGIPAVTYFICGLAGDTRESIASALQLTASLPTMTGISLFYPVPGLEGFEGIGQFGTHAMGLARGSLAYPWTGSLTTEEMVTAFRLSRYINLHKSGEKKTHSSLIETISKEKRLFTYSRDKKIVPVHKQNRDLAEAVLSAL